MYMYIFYTYLIPYLYSCRLHTSLTASFILPGSKIISKPDVLTEEIIEFLRILGYYAA